MQNKEIFYLVFIYKWQTREYLLVELTGCRFWLDKKPYPKELIEIFANYFSRFQGST